MTYEDNIGTRKELVEGSRVSYITSTNGDTLIRESFGVRLGRVSLKSYTQSRS